jgi:hypothetical protein
MKAAQMLVTVCALFFPIAVVAKDAPKKADPIQTSRKVLLPVAVRPSGIVRQDLFDRNDPNNLRSDYPAPPAQPGQF